MEQGIKSKLTDNEIKKILKERYGKCAEAGVNLTSSCCAIETSKSPSFGTDHSLYTQEDILLIPETALNLSRGCGNPTGFSALKTGEVVVDFGCGAGIDVILAVQKVAPSGRVIGIDFAPEMIERAKQAIDEIGFSDSVDLRIAELHQTDLPSNFADAVISNCVINLCPDKEAVYQEAYRILKPGGRLAISDVVYIEKIDSQVYEQFKKTWSGCLGGAIEKDSYFDIIENIGFTGLHIVSKHPLASNELDEMACCPGAEYTPVPSKEDLAATQNKIASIKFTAIKPQTSD